MDFIATRVNELLSRVSPIKRWLISDVANEYYREGYQDGQKLVYRNVLKGNALKEFIEILNHCGIKLSYNLRKGGLIVSVRPDKLPTICNVSLNVIKMKVKKTRNFSDAPPLDVQYNYIMENFDFDKVLEYMSWDKSHRTYDDDGKCVGKSPWRMYISPGEYRVPSISDLRALARDLLTQVIRNYRNSKSTFVSISTGPFKAMCRYGMLELIGVIESWSDD